MNLKIKTIKYFFLSFLRRRSACSACLFGRQVGKETRFGANVANLFVAVLAVGLFALSSQAQADYSAQGIVASKNMLSGATVTAINGFQITATIPSGTAVSVKFSQDKVNYYNSAGVKEGWDACTNGTTNINLSSLAWSGGLLFYKLQLGTTNVALTPTVSDVQVDYDGTAVAALSGNSYPAKGTVVSTDLLSGGTMVFDNTARFAYNVSSLPSGTSASVQFSKDAVSWYSSNGTLWGEDVLAVGSHLDATNSLSLAALNWAGTSSFYYKLNLYSPLDEYITPVIGDAGLIKSDHVYYSVGQFASDLKTGTPTLTLTAGSAVFSVAQTGNIGVGDRVTYDTDKIAYIAAKTNSDGLHWNLVTATGSVPSDISNSTVVSIKREFTSLSAAVTAASNSTHLNSTDLVAANVVLNLPCYYDSAADTAAVAVSGYTTGVSNYIKIYTPNNTSTEANNSQRHQGKWDDGKYVLSSASQAIGISSVRVVKIEGVQISVTRNVQYAWGIRNLVGSDAQIFVTNNIIRGAFSGSAHNLYGIDFSFPGNKYYILNNIVYGFKNGDYMDNYAVKLGGYGGFGYVYNNIVFDSYIGYHRSEITLVARNNIAQNCNDGYSGLFDASSDYNISNLASDAPGANSKNSTTVQFADAANKDFHLAPNDTAAKNVGTDLSADSGFAFSSDIDGQTRSGSWDIGADEAATAIYYSVGQNTTSHETGSGTVTVDATARTATFSVAQTATNMGVGDLVTYTGGSCYITSKTSTSVWGCQNATGGAPTAATNADVTSIAHAFASLNAAVTGADDLLGTSDLVTGNYQLNFPCYYDTGADTTVVTITEYKTGLENYIKIYTPNNIVTEVNQSQRHQGKWGDGKYKLEAAGISIKNFADPELPIGSDSKNIKIEGLQIAISGSVQVGPTTVAAGIMLASPNSEGDFSLSENIVKGNHAYAAEREFGIVSLSQSQKIFNNIIYDIAGVNYGYGLQVQSHVNSSIYNNTIYGCTYGVIGFGGSGTMFKNNIVNNSEDGDYDISEINGSIVFENNISQDDSSPNEEFQNQTVSFADSVNKDFHLSPTDTAAKGAGMDLQHDANFAFDRDIDGQVRVSPWDIGADQFGDTVVQTAQEAPALDAGLVGHWTFDGDDIDWGKSTGQIKDLSGNANNGTVSGLTKASVADGKLGQGLSFNGTSSYVSVQDNSNLDIANEITTCAWYFDPGAANGYLFAKSNATWSYAFDISNSTQQMFFRLSSNGTSNDGVVAYPASSFAGGLNEFDNSWVHVCGTLKDSLMSIYINGQFKNSTPFAGPIYQNADDFFVGTQKPTNGKFNSKLDDVRVYNRALSATEIGQLYKLGQDTLAASEASRGDKDGLVGYWSFDGPTISGTTVSDLSGIGNNGTISGATVADGKIGQGMGFNGSTSEIIVANNANTYLNFANGSVSLWYKAAGFGDYPRLFSFEQGGDYISVYFLSATTLVGRHQADYGGVKEINVTVPNLNTDKNWHHVVFAWDATGGTQTLKMSLDDAITTDNDVIAVPTLFSGSAHIGSGEASRFFNGIIDEVKVYNRTLANEEIGNLYNLGKVEIKK